MPTKQERTTILEERMESLEQKLGEHLSKSYSHGNLPPVLASYPSPFCAVWGPPILAAPPPPPPPPPPDQDGFDLGALGDLIKGTVPKSGGTGPECTTKTILANWTGLPRTRTVTIAHIGNITINAAGSAGGSLDLQGTGSVTIDVELQPGQVLEIHIDSDNAKFAAWW